MENVIECSGLSKHYKTTQALKNVNIQIPDCGGMIGLLGPNGSGKTTFIKLLTGLLTPTSGEIKVMGHSIGAESKAMVSYLSDSMALTPNYTVEQEIEYFDDFFLDFDKEKALRMLAELGVNPKNKIRTLSKGTKEKVALILTLSRNARLFILDEPIAGVDPASRDYILRTILAHKNENATMLISTHLIAEIEQYFNYVLFLREGEIILQGEAETIRQREGKTIDELFREMFRWIV